MSGAAEGIAGLALSSISVAALFTTVIQCFEVVIAAKRFSDDYEQLCSLFSLQRTRFGLWGESVGLIPNPSDGCCLRYNKNLDRPDIRPEVERVLNNIKSLLEEAGRVNERYGLKVVPLRDTRVSTSRGADIFKESFERFKSQLRKHQKDTSVWKVTRWSIRDAGEFEVMINRLEKFVDGLESITTSLGLLEQQRARLREEIDSISDVESLRLLRDASSHRSFSHTDISDTASQRLIAVANSISEDYVATTASMSFVTAETRPFTMGESHLSERVSIPGAWPRSIMSDPRDEEHAGLPLRNLSGGVFRPSRSCKECLDEHYKCTFGVETESCTRCMQTRRECSFSREQRDEAIPVVPMDEPSSTTLDPEDQSKPQELPQNQRLMRELTKQANPSKFLSFKAGDANYGKRLATTKDEDDKYYLDNGHTLVFRAHEGSSAVKRMFFELRNIRTSKVPFISAVPLEDRLDKVLASIEGPPETPYEGGVFWITVKMPERDPSGPPLMKFHTKIYHPNVSPQGHICADYAKKWYAVLSTDTFRSPGPDKDSWYRAKPTGIQWSLGALLTALCGLLASPDVDDPLVLEIAQKYIDDYDGYCENARLYTQRYATGPRPDPDSLVFPEETPLEESVGAPVMGKAGSASDAASISSKQSTRGVYYDVEDYGGNPVERWDTGNSDYHSGLEEDPDAATISSKQSTLGVYDDIEDYGGKPIDPWHFPNSDDDSDLEGDSNAGRKPSTAFIVRM